MKPTANITLLGTPLSTNHVYKSTARNGYVSVYLSPAGKERKKQYQNEVFLQWKHAPRTDDEVVLHVDYYFGNRRRVDWDNFFKIVGDSLNSIVFIDDSQIIEAKVRKHYDKTNPRVEIKIR